MIRTNIARIDRRISIAAKRYGNTVVMHWTSWTHGKPAPDPTTGARLATDSTAPVDSSMTFQAFFHEIAPSTSSYRVHAEIQTGDAIMDLPSSISIDGLDNPYFIVNGQKWTQKETSGELAKHWDVEIGNHKLLRGVLLRKAT